MKKMERRFNITYIAMLIGIFPAVVFIASYINIKIFFVPNIIDEIKDSINDYPLSKFYYSSICNESEYPISLYTFPGSKEGCSCLNVTYYYRKQDHVDEVFPGQCNKNQTANKCKMVKEIKSVELFKWKNGTFCSKHYNLNEIEGKNGLSGYFYFLNNSVREKESCKEGFKKCGKLDDYDNYLCLPINEECPINDIISSDIERPDLIDDGYKSQYINNMYFYYTNEKVDKPVITKLKVGEKSLCVYKTFHFTDYPQYILDQNFNKYGCKYKIKGKFYEDNTEKLDKTTKKELYEDSYLTLNSEDYYNSILHEFPFHSLQEEMYLYPKRYIGFNKKCLLEHGGLNINTFIHNENENDIRNIIPDKVFKYNNLIMWFSIFGFAIEIFAHSVIEVDNKDHYYFIIAWSVVNCICYIVMSTPVYMNHQKLKNIKPLPLCGGPIINEKIKLFNKVEQTFKSTTVSQIVFLNLQLVFIIIIVLVRVKYQYWDGFKPPSYYENKKKKNKKDGDKKKENNFSEEKYYEIDEIS